MQEYFAGAWYLIALANRFDTHHAAARRLEAQTVSRHLVTHDGVLTEVLTHFSGAGAQMRQRVVDLTRRVLVRGITHLLTNNRHFRREGFTVLSDAR